MDDDRRFSRKKKARETKIGTDSTGAEYWLVPFSEAKVGHRKFQIRNSKKQVPVQLQGMFTDTSTAERLFRQFMSQQKAKTSSKKPAAAKADAE